jgi:hypothetical protein
LVKTVQFRAVARLHDVFREYLAVLDEGLRAPALREVAGRFGKAADQAPPAEQDAVLDGLAKAIRTLEIERASHAAFMAGSLVDIGANPEIAAPAVVERLVEILPDVRTFGDACRSRAGDDAVTPEIQQQVADDHPEVVGGWNAFQNLPMAAISMISRSKELRSTLRKTPALRDELEKIDAQHFLVMLLHVLDDEPLVVLHPELRQGYRMKISGISDNFQLHTLLADALIGFWKLKGTRPHRSVVQTARGFGPQENPLSVQGVWDLCPWMALQPDFALPRLGKGMLPAEMMIWGEGVPSDIPKFEGTRTILLGPPSYGRGWSANRIFSGLQASLETTGALDQAEVQGLMSRILEAKKALRPG